MDGADGLQLSQVTAEVWACHISAFKGSPNFYICDILLPQVVATSLLQLHTCYQQAPKSVSALLLISAHSQWDHQKSELSGTGTDWTHALAYSTEMTNQQRYWKAVGLQLARLHSSAEENSAFHTHLWRDFQLKPLVTPQNLVQLMFSASQLFLPKP